MAKPTPHHLFVDGKPVCGVKGNALVAMTAATPIVNACARCLKAAKARNLPLPKFASVEESIAATCESAGLPVPAKIEQVVTAAVHEAAPTIAALLGETPKPEIDRAKLAREVAVEFMRKHDDVHPVWVAKRAGVSIEEAREAVRAVRSEALQATESKLEVVDLTDPAVRAKHAQEHAHESAPVSLSEALRKPKKVMTEEVKAKLAKAKGEPKPLKTFLLDPVITYKPSGKVDTITGTCPECKTNKRTIHAADAFQVKRCVECQKKAVSKRVSSSRKEKEAK